MKLHTYVTSLIAFTLLLCGCSLISETPQQRAADAVYGAGYASAADNLDNNANLVATIQQVAVKLPLINDASLSDTDRGVLVGNIKVLIANNTLLKSAVPADSSKLDSAIAFLSGALSSSSSVNGGKSPTMDAVAANTALIQFSNGLLGGIQFWQGKHSVVAPTP